MIDNRKRTFRGSIFFLICRFSFFKFVLYGRGRGRAPHNYQIIKLLNYNYQITILKLNQKIHLIYYYNYIIYYYNYI